MRLLLLFLVLLQGCEGFEEEFEHWAARHGRRYSPAEAERRRAVYATNLAAIHAHNEQVSERPLDSLLPSRPPSRSVI